MPRPSELLDVCTAWHQSDFSAATDESMDDLSHGLSRHRDIAYVINVIGGSDIAELTQSDMA